MRGLFTITLGAALAIGSARALSPGGAMCAVVDALEAEFLPVLAKNDTAGLGPWSPPVVHPQGGMILFTWRVGAVVAATSGCGCGGIADGPPARSVVQVQAVLILRPFGKPAEPPIICRPQPLESNHVLCGRDGFPSTLVAANTTAMAQGSLILAMGATSPGSWGSAQWIGLPAPNDTAIQFRGTGVTRSLGLQAPSDVARGRVVVAVELFKGWYGLTNAFYPVPYGARALRAVIRVTHSDGTAGVLELVRPASVHPAPGPSHAPPQAQGAALTYRFALPYEAFNPADGQLVQVHGVGVVTEHTTYTARGDASGMGVHEVSWRQMALCGRPGPCPADDSGAEAFQYSAFHFVDVTYYYYAPSGTESAGPAASTWPPKPSPASMSCYRI
eukprot:gene7451-180_t